MITIPEYFLQYSIWGFLSSHQKQTIEMGLEVSGPVLSTAYDPLNSIPETHIALSNFLWPMRDKVNYRANIMGQFLLETSTSSRNFSRPQWALTHYFCLWNIWKMSYVYNRHHRKTDMKHLGKKKSNSLVCFQELRGDPEEAWKRAALTVCPHWAKE